MKVNEIEINSKIYRIVKDYDGFICETCALKDYCNNSTQDGDEIHKICQSHHFDAQFKEINNIVNIKKNIKLYRFSTGTVFHVNHIKDIVDMGYVELCIEDPTKYGFTILMTNGVVIFVRFDTKLIATRERNKFIKFIERYGY